MKTKIRNYEIHNRLGSGSYGVIFKAINKNDKQPCVLKQIRMNKMSDKAKKSTLNEATIMGKLIHPFIVQYKESFVEDDTLHIVMQYCDNGDLSMYLKMQNKKPLKEEKIWKFFIQICLGLEYIHKNKILHRDIKTLNIFLNKNQDIKIGDLGVAKMLMANDFAQTIVGTPFYLSPELCEQKPYNEKSDIWALGCLLYELCTFRHPFEAANQASLILKIIRGKYSPIPEFYSKQLKDVIDMCLERDYKRRPTASMLVQRTKVRQYIKEFKLEEKIKEEYEKMKANKENKHPQNNQNLQANKAQNVVKPVQKKVIESSPPQKPVVPEAKKQVSNNQKVVSQAQIANRKISVEKKQPVSYEKKPTVSGMPEQNIILPDKNNIIEKLKPNNPPLLPPKPQVKSPVPTPLLKQHQSHKRIKQNKEQFLKNLQKVIDHNVNLKKSPIKEKPKNQEVSTSAIIEQKSRLERIDMKIQQQLKKQQEIQKIKALNDRKKSQTPSLGNNKPEDKILLGSDRKSVPALISKDSGKQVGRYQSNHVKQVQNALIPPLPPKNKQQIIKVKMQQPPIPPKVYESNKSSDLKNKGIIKSKGFSQELKEENNSANKIQDRKSNDFKRKSVQNVAKPVLFGLDDEERQKQEFGKNEVSQKKSSHESVKPSQYHSERNIKVISEMPGSVSRGDVKKEPERYLFKKKPQPQISVGANSRVRNKGNSNYNDLSRNAKNASKHSQVTKQDQDVVMNLPDSLTHNNDDSSDEQLYQNNKEIKMNKNFELKDINNSTVLQKYEQIINSKSSISSSVKSSPRKEKQPILPSHETQILKASKKQVLPPKRINKNLNEYDENEENEKVEVGYFIPQQKIDDSEIDRMIMEPSICIEKQDEKLQFIPENESLAFKTQRYDDESDEILDESQELIDCEQKEIQGDAEYHPNGIEQEIYEINNFNLDDQMLQDNQQYQPNEPQNSYNSHQYNLNPSKQQTQSQWSFDQQPQLPMLQDKQSPFFQQANPYLVPQQQQQTIQQKRNYLQIRLQQNIKREDEINKLMQIKIEECKAVVPKYFDEILEFFRKKINKQDQYTENDEKEVEEFLRKKGLTDQRKFQNIYKIMHFEMELQNTRKIIQRICKKLSDLDHNLDED